MELFQVISSGHLNFLDGPSGWHWLSSDEVQVHHVCVQHGCRLLGCIQKHESHSHGRQMQAVYYLPSSVSNWSWESMK